MVPIHFELLSIHLEPFIHYFAANKSLRKLYFHAFPLLCTLHNVVGSLKMLCFTAKTKIISMPTHALTTKEIHRAYDFNYML